MTPKEIAVAMALLTATSAPAWAGGAHSTAGEPGDPAAATETVTLVARETDDGRMVYEPSEIVVAEGATVHLVIDNQGAAEHELVLGTRPEIEEHAEEMAKFPEMEHAEPNMVRVDPGSQDGIYWQFTEQGTYTIACLMPGHMELGMVGRVTVVDPARADAGS